MQTLLALDVIAIDPDRLQRMRDDGRDETGNPWVTFPAEGWEPLRCCLTRPSSGTQIALITYSPWTTPSPWAESGPVFVHADACSGWSGSGWPEAFRNSHSALQPFDSDGARAYDHITFVQPDDDHEEAVRRVLAADGVEVVHVRSATAQCFTFEVRASVRPECGDQGLRRPVDVVVADVEMGHRAQVSAVQGADQHVPGRGTARQPHPRRAPRARRCWSRPTPGR